MFSGRYSKKPESLYVRKSTEELEPQEILLDRLAREQESEGHEEKKLEVPVSRWSIRALYVLFVLMALVFIGKTFEFQIFSSDEMKVKAKENTIRSIPVVPERGVFYDSSGIQLVFNRSSFDVVCDKRDLPQGRYERERMLAQLSLLFKIPFETVKKNFDEITGPQLLIVENMSHEQLVIAETRTRDFPGCEIQENTIREYIDGKLLAHVLGYTAKISRQELQEYTGYSITDQIGKTGLEKSYETSLRGVAGQVLFERDAFGRIVKERGELPSEPGSNLVLWLDLSLQESIAQKLQAALDRVGAEKGAAVAIDPKTGGVLALVSYPTFDSNLFSRGITQAQYEEIISNAAKPLFNRATAGMYPTGSTIKPLIASAVLQEEIISPDKSLLTKGYIEIPNQYDPEIVYIFHDWKNHGWVDMRDAIAVSSNVYFYIVGGGFENQKGLGPTRIKKYLSLFGWGQETGIDIPGESEGFIPDPSWKKEVKNEGWWDGDTYLLSIGQGDLLTTPLQVAMAFTAITNGGTLYQPQIVKEIVSNPRGTLGSGASLTEIEPKIIRSDFIDKENIQVVREGMRQAVTWGSSVLLNQLPVKVAAKTGTAQTGRTDSEGKDFLYIWTTAFAPYDDPEIVLTVLIEDVKEGNVAVLPVIKEILGAYFTR
ncbi:penicillin-binding protein 2 [Patescibacteria group bacterium]|nr:penicillin-binding protein 2 [Patescibacteria group bacterium]